MKTALTIAIAASLAGCAFSPAASNIEGMKKVAADYGLTCPAAKPLVVYANTDGYAQGASVAFPGGVIKMPAAYRDGEWSKSVAAHEVMAHEVAHTCGADEQTSRSVAKAWAGSGTSFNTTH